MRLILAQSGARIWISAAIAIGGTTLISFDGSSPNVGDGFSLAAAVASALFILKLEAASQRELLDHAALNACTLAVNACLCLAWTGMHVLFSEPSLEFSLWENALPLLYLSTVATFVANWLQAFGQSTVGAPVAVIIFSLDPVYGAVFSWLLLGEQLGLRGGIGCALVLAAVVLSWTASNAVMPAYKPRVRSPTATQRSEYAYVGIPA